MTTSSHATETDQLHPHTPSANTPSAQSPSAQTPSDSEVGQPTSAATPREGQPNVNVVISDEELRERAERWASTMRGHHIGDVAVAHEDSWAGSGTTTIRSRSEREAVERDHLTPLATQASGSGNRILEEPPDPFRTCFERDRDRIYHATAFRRLAGKTQVFLFPEDHQRNRLTHALEVAQVARSVSTALGLNVALTEAIAIGHDCGHGPGGHASEDALSPYLPDGFDHAVWGADVTLVDLNLCQETLDGVRNHSWSRPAPGTPEGEVVSWADRIAYVCHDFEDAVATGVVAPGDLPDIVRERVGTTRSAQLGAFIRAMIEATAETGRIGMIAPVAEALAAFRRFNYEQIYLRPDSKDQGRGVVTLLRSLVDYYVETPSALPERPEPGTLASWAADSGPGESDDVDPVLFAAVGYVAGMTDRYACRQAVDHLGWSADRLPTTMTQHDT